MSVTPPKDAGVTQLIDANLDRAKEGLRVIEDWCRFGLKRKELVIRIKDWRQQLGVHHIDLYKKARCTATDQGIGLTHPAQKTRTTSQQVVEANFSRVQEALRVLEEFTRHSDNDLAVLAAKIRYDLYELETTILEANFGEKIRKTLYESKVCLITKPHPSLLETIHTCLTAGIKMVQYRSKNKSDVEKLSEIKELSLICKDFEAILIINDRVDLAMAVDADGVHLGQEDLPIEIARKLFGNEKIIGCSTHSFEQVKDAEKKGFDYIGVGPIYTTKTKPQKEPIGINYMQEVSNEISLPWFAIGGINSSNLKEVISAGASRIAVVDAIMNSDEPAIATRNLLEKFK